MGDSGNLVLTDTSDYILQQIYPEAELDGLPVGATITGMRLQPCGHANCTNDWVDTTVTQFEVRLSTSENEAGSVSLTMSENRGADEVIVIPETSWDIVADDYHNDECQAHVDAGTGPCAFGPVISFEEGFVYAGGSILMEVASVGGKTDTFFVSTSDADAGSLKYRIVNTFDEVRVSTDNIGDYMIHIAFVYTD